MRPSRQQDPGMKGMFPPLVSGRPHGIFEGSVQSQPLTLTGTCVPGGGGDFIPSLPGCVCPRVNDIGPLLASSE